MVWALAVLSFLVATFVGVLGFWALRCNYMKARKYAVTLRSNQGAFVGLCVKKYWGTWHFVDVRLLPDTPGGPVAQAAPGTVYVPYRNILYYQEIQETANATE